jgi:predicted lysophospholipase L1 biosynthesis ABC-type transport system permease subunit
MAPLVGLIAMVCVLFGAVVFGANLNRLTHRPALYGANFDFALGQGETEISADVQRQLDASRDVGALTLYGTTSAAIRDRSMDIVGMRPVRGGLVPELFEGRLPAGDAEIDLGRVTARELGVKVGDALEVNGASGPGTYRVVGLALVPPVGGADSLGKSALVTNAGFLRLDPSAKMNTEAVRVAGDAPPGAATRIGAAIGSPIGQSDPPPAIINLRRVNNIPLFVGLAVGLLVMLSLGHLMIVSVRRQRLDHAILRAIGATPRWVSGVIHWQASLITLVGAAVALPIGIAAGRLIYGRVVTDIGAKGDVGVPVLALAGAVAILLVLANVSAALPARRSRRDSPTTLLNRA